MDKDSLNFTDVNRKSEYGRSGLQFFIGTVVSFDHMKDQIANGYTWRYKVRIDGDQSVSKDQVTDDKLKYSYCVLPTTAGSGAAYKLRSVRISQGDTVFGLRGGGEDPPQFIIGVLPRTIYTSLKKSGNFATLSGFWSGGGLKQNDTLSGEINGQLGPTTPGVTPLDPKTYNKSNRDDPSGNLEQLGYDQNQDGEIDDVEAKLTPPRVAGDRKWDEGEPINSAQLEYILSNQTRVEITRPEPIKVNGEVVGYEQVGTGTFRTVNLMDTEESSSYTRKVLDQAVTQNLVTRDIADEALKDLKNGNVKIAVEKIFPPPPPTSD